MQVTGNRELSPFQASYVLTVLLLAYILSFIDRTVMAVLIGPIREDFAINDFQYSLLHGPACTFFYVILGLPIARLADRKSRRLIISVGIGLWSMMTCLCGLATSFASLFVMRMGVGVGEASLSPPTHSLLADTFSARRLPMALSIFSLGIPVGSGLAFIIGGWVYGLFAGADAISLPVVGDLNPWQLTFVAVGLPGFLVALLMLFAKEPPRRGLLAVDKARENEQPALPIKAIIHYIWQRRRLYSAPFIGISLLSILGYGMMTWYLEYMVRSFGVDRSVVGPQFGLLFIVAVRWRLESVAADFCRGRAAGLFGCAAYVVCQRATAQGSASG
jgi:MFS family permease